MPQYAPDAGSLGRAVYSTRTLRRTPRYAETSDSRPRVCTKEQGPEAQAAPGPTLLAESALRGERPRRDNDGEVREAESNDRKEDSLTSVLHVDPILPMDFERLSAQDHRFTVIRRTRCPQGLPTLEKSRATQARDFGRWKVMRCLALAPSTSRHALPLSRAASASPNTTGISRLGCRGRTVNKRARRFGVLRGDTVRVNGHWRATYTILRTLRACGIDKVKPNELCPQTGYPP